MFVPAPGEALNQLPPEVVLAVAVQFRVPPPVLEMFTIWSAGLAPPCAPVKIKDVILSEIVGGGVTVSGTVMVCGVLVAPTAATSIEPL